MELYNLVASVNNPISHPRWNDSGNVNIFGTDKFGFGALPSGFRLNSYGPFNIIGDSITFFCSNEINISISGICQLQASDTIAVIDSQPKNFGFSVRAVRAATTAEQLLHDGLISATYTDYDGNIYSGTKIGLQVWTTSNLKTTHYADGTLIPTNLSDAAWVTDIDGACAVNGKNDGAFVPTDELTTEALMVAAYGRLYNWYAVDRHLVTLPFPFCAPADFDPETQPVNIIDVYNKYNNPEKKYIFTLRDAVEKFALTQGTTVRHGYELDGVQHVDDYNVIKTTINGTITAGNYTEVLINDTSGLSSSGTIRINYYSELWTEFIYTSKTLTSVIGVSQALPNISNNQNVTSVINLVGTKRWIIVNGNINKELGDGLYDGAVLIDVFGSISNAVAVNNCYEWLYCGKYVEWISCGNAGFGYGSVKYIHLENETQLKIFEYTDFYGVTLTGELNIPKSITEIGYVSTESYNYWVGFRAGHLTKVTISENVVLIVDSFNHWNTLLRFDCYPLVAPTIVTDGHSFMNGHPVPLHIRPNSTGYDVAPWTDTSVFTEIIEDLEEPVDTFHVPSDTEFTTLTDYLCTIPGITSANVGDVLKSKRRSGASFNFAYLPENFEGVKIVQKFYFTNPIGYTPKFSVDTMRIIGSDKNTIDAVFDEFGLESDVEIEIQKLNSTGTTYEALPNSPLFAIDFESYEKFDVYSEFALKSVSVIDFYNKVKNTEIQIALTENFGNNLPTDLVYINYVSLKEESFVSETAKKVNVHFQSNNTSKLYDGDSSLFNDGAGGYAVLTPETSIYTFGETFVFDAALFFLSLQANLTITASQTSYISIKLFKYKHNGSGLEQISGIYYGTVAAGATEISINEPILGIDATTFSAGDSIIMQIESNVITISVTGSIFIDIKKVTVVPIVKSTVNDAKYVPIRTVLSEIFDSSITIPATTGGDRTWEHGVTSANNLISNFGYANFKPKDFLSDFCLMAGLILNFKIDGTVVIAKIYDYFNTLLDIANATEITDYKDLSKKYNTDLNFASVSVGQDANEYDVYPYLLDWNKILTFSQTNRNASENLELTLSKFRTDFSGILDYFLKRSKQTDTKNKANFIFDPSLSPIYIDATGAFFDWTSNPRYILLRWSKFLSFCFQNYGKDTLTISSNGGTVDNLELTPGIFQMDDLVLSETPRLTPNEYNFTALLPDTDFSEKILKINDNGENIYIFVIETNTTDKLSEQKIKGLKIQFT